MRSSVASGFLFLLLLVPPVVADPIVAGVVVDKDDNPVSGAEVNAECDGARSGPAYTLDDGSYALDFTGTTCDVGDTVYVTATANGQSGSNSGEVRDQTFIKIAVVNVSLIPEFPAAAIPAALAAGGYLVTRMRMRRRM